MERWDQKNMSPAPPACGHLPLRDAASTSPLGGGSPVPEDSRLTQPAFCFVPIVHVAAFVTSRSSSNCANISESLI